MSTEGWFLMADSRLYVHVLLDRSGSMESCRDTTIEAFNEYVGSLRHQSQAGTRLSLTTFDSESTDLVFDTLRIGEVPRLTRDTFVPRGSTPLYDAVGAVVARIDKVTLVPDERVALAILTDGHENASREMTADAVRKLLLDRQERCKWLVQYLGANQDAWSVGATLGVAPAHSLSFGMESVDAALHSASESVRRYRAAPAPLAQAAASFSDEERARSKPSVAPPASAKR